MKKIILLLVITVTGFSFTFAQKTISGKVTDEKANTALQGVTISLKNGGSLATSDAQGNFSLSVPASTKSLVFSSVGYNDKEVIIAGGELDVKMSLGNNKSLTEIVVTGYSTRSRRSSSGSVTPITIDEIHTQPIASFDQLLQGQAAGVFVTTGSGQPGSSADVQIRGRGSLNGSTNPLYIIDGVQVNAADFATLNQGDFESINIMKDAAATSIYGSRAAGGVVVITTKKGKAGPLRLNYDFQYGQNDWPGSKLKLMTSAEKLEYELDHGNPNNWTSRDVDSLSKINTDWEKVFFHTGITQTHQLSVSGGNDKTRFYGSLGYFDQSGIVRETGLKRYTGRLNVESGSDRFKFGFNTSFGFSKLENTNENDQFIGSPLNAIRWSLPYVTPYDKDGNYTVDNTQNAQPNPLKELLENPTNTNQWKAIGNAYAEYKIPFVKGLTARSNWGLDYTQNELTAIISPDTYSGKQTVGGVGSYQHLFTRQLRFIGTNSLNYKKTFGNNHDFSISAYQEYIESNSRNFGFTGYGLILPFINESAITPGTDENGFIPAVNGGGTKNTLISYFTEADYGYLNKYFLHAGFRRDGSSRFGVNNRYASFYNVGASWIISDENFMLPVKGTLELLKLKMSYGTVGNQNLNTGVASLNDFGSRPLFGKVSYNGEPGLGLGTPGNPDLRWEQKSTFNIGLEYAFLKNRLSGSFEVYNSKTNDLFYNTPLSQTTGFLTQLSNAGTLSNKGVEINIKLVPLKTKNFTWTIDANYTHNTNRVTSLPNGTDTVPNNGTFLKIGKPAESFFLVKYAGVDPANGDALYYTKDGKTTNVYSPNDRQFFGSADAPNFGGITNTFKYKGVQLEIFWIYSLGNEVFNNDRQNVENPAYLVSELSKDVLREWRNPGDITDVPRSTVDYQLPLTNYFLENGSFWRLRNVRVSYELDKSLLRKLKINSVRVFAQGQNLYTYTKYRGYDPEVPPQQAVGTTSIGVNGGAQYPTLKTITFGINVGL